MNILAIAGSAILGLLPFVFSPSRTFARGGVFRYAGAALLVLSMMLLFWSVRDMMGAGDAATAETPGITDADLKALQKVFGG